MYRGNHQNTNYPVLSNSKEPGTIKLATVKPGEEIRDVPYCGGQLMDLYQPRKIKYEKSPTVLYLHGGGWTMNDKASEPDQLAMIDNLRDEGYVVASINYRKVPDGFFPDAVRDSHCAVRFLKAQAGTYQLDHQKIALYGFSAGGYLAAMVGVSADNPSFMNGEYSDQSSQVQAVVTLAGIFDFEQGLTEGNRERIDRFLNGADRDTSDVISHVDSDSPPYLLLHGSHDQFVPLDQDELLEAALKERGVSLTRKVITNADHGLNGVAGEPDPTRDEVKKIMAAFIHKNLQTDTASRKEERR